MAVTAGPGATNLVTGVTAAILERVPLIAIGGDVPWVTTGKKLLQDTGPYGIGIERMLQGRRALLCVSREQRALPLSCTARSRPHSIQPRPGQC